MKTQRSLEYLRVARDAIWKNREDHLSGCVHLDGLLRDNADELLRLFARLYQLRLQLGQFLLHDGDLTKSNKNNKRSRESEFGSMNGAHSLYHGNTRPATESQSKLSGRFYPS